MNNIEAGDVVGVDIEAPANPFASTQTATFDVTEVDDTVIRGVDPNWGDDVVVEVGGGDEIHYQDGGKSGRVVELRVHEAHEDGGYWGDRYDVVYQQGGD